MIHASSFDCRDLIRARSLQPRNPSNRVSTSFPKDVLAPRPALHLHLPAAPKTGGSGSAQQHKIRLSRLKANIRRSSHFTCRLIQTTRAKGERRVAERRTRSLTVQRGMRALTQKWAALPRGCSGSLYLNTRSSTHPITLKESLTSRRRCIMCRRRRRPQSQ